MKAKWFLLAALGVLAVSCMVKEPEQDVMVTDAPKIVATFGSDGPSTKVSVTESDGQTRQTFWEKGDGIAVFMHNGRALEYALEGDGGESTGIFSYAGGVGGGLDFPGVYGVYPFDKGVGFDGSEVSLTFPAEQNYRADAFDPKANIMVAASQTNELFFRNVGGYLVLKLYGEDVSVSKVTVRGNAGEPLAGPATVWVSETEAPEIEVTWETAEKAVTLVCATPVKVGATEADGTEFWFVLPPTEFEEGLTVTVSDGKGGTFTRSATGWIDLARSEVYRLATEVELEYLNGFEYVEMAPGLKIATKNVGAETPGDRGDTFAWGEVEPKNLYTPNATGDNWNDYKWFVAAGDSYYQYGIGYTGYLSKYTEGYYFTEDGWESYEFVQGDFLIRLEPEDDAATVNWGSEWRMPTKEQMSYLANPEYFTWTEATRTDSEGNEVDGYEVVSQVPGYEGNTVFFPNRSDEEYYSTGECRYWTSDVNPYYSYGAPYSLSYALADYYTTSPSLEDSYYRWAPLHIRPVFGTVPFESMTLNRTAVEIPVDGKFSLNVKGYTPEYASDTFSWSVSDETVASLTVHKPLLDCEVHALKPGTVEITATAESGISVSCTLTVIPQVTLFGKQWAYTDSEGVQKILDLKCSYNTYSIIATVDDSGEYAYFTGPYVTFANSNWPQISVDSEGNIIYDACYVYFTNPTETSSLIRLDSGEEYTATVVDPSMDLVYACPQLIFGGTGHEMRTSTGYGVDSRFKFWDELMERNTDIDLPIYVLKDDEGNMAYGLEEDFEGLDLTGKIVVVSRGGEIRYDAKANHAAEAGAAAILIVNNQEDDGWGLNMSELKYKIPHFLVQLDCYDYLMEANGVASFNLANLQEYEP